MREKTSDTRVPLEWNKGAGYWTCPLLVHEWAKLLGLLSRDDSNFSQISSDKYHEELSPDKNEYRILWTAPIEERPSDVYALVAVRPKKPETETVLGIPLPVLIPIIAAFATAIGTIAVQKTSAMNEGPSVAQVCGESQDWVSAAELGTCTVKLDEAVALNESLESCRQEQIALHKISQGPQEKRVNFLLGRSHGLRQVAIKHLHANDTTARQIALQTEKTYIENILLGESSPDEYTHGMHRGQQEAIDLIGMGEFTFISGQDLFEHLR